MKVRKLIPIIALVLALALLCGCGSSGGTDSGSSEYQKIDLVMAVNGTDTQIDSRVARYFADMVEEKSGGNITVDVFPNDQLAGGNATKGIEMIAQGSVDLAAYATCTLAVIDSQLPVATIPWSFDSYQDARKVIDETGGDYYAERLAKKGITYLGSFHNGFRQITNSKTVVDDPSDLKNLKSYLHELERSVHRHPAGHHRRTGKRCLRYLHRQDGRGPGLPHHVKLFV